MKKIKWTKKKMILAALLLVILAATGYAMFSGDAISVDTHTVATGDVVDTYDVVGVIQADRDRIFHATTSAEVEEISVAIGDAVSSGQVLVTFDDESILLQNQALEAQRESVRYNMEEALGPAQTDQVAAQQAVIRGIDVDLSAAEKALEDAIALNKAGAISQKALEEAEDMVKRLKAQRSSAVSQLALLRRQGSDNVKGQFEAQMAAIDAEIAGIEKLIDSGYSIQATFDGTIVDLFVETGDFLQPTQPIIEIADLDTLEIEARVLAEHVGDLSLDTRARISLDNGDGWTDAAIKKIHPKVIAEMSDLGIEQRKVIVELVFTDGMNHAVLGQEVDVELVLDERSDVLQIPDTAYYEDGDTAYVFLVNEGVLEHREVTLGLEGDDNVEVTGGLVAGDTIVLEIDNDLEEGLRVE